MDLRKSAFRWAVGIESSCIPHLSISQYEWTQHERFWREDFLRVAQDLGCHWMRYSLPWHTVEPKAGVFNWKWADERISFARELGIELILDLVHFGTPTWLPDSFGDPDFPHAMERYTKAFARQYNGIVHSVCPINEPLITALFCGDVGLWPPHGRNLKVYMTVLSRIAQALSRSIRVLRELAPQTEVVVCDALEYPTIAPNSAETVSQELFSAMEKDLELRLNRRHIVLDLATGKVDEYHPLFAWLETNGFPRIDMNWFLRNRVQFDLLGLDYYSHSEMELYACSKHQFRQRVPETLAGLRRSVRDYWERYRKPMMITETSHPGNVDEKRAWFKQTVSDVRELRSEGIPILGYTWWPLLDHLDWDGALLHQIGKIHHVGVFCLERDNGDLLRKATAFTNEYRVALAQGGAVAGELKMQSSGTVTQATVKADSAVSTYVQLDFPIIVHCHLRWDGVWQRPQQFISRLSETHRVLFVEGPILMSEPCAPYSRLTPAQGFPHITIMQTFFPASRFEDGDWVDRERLRLLREALSGPLRGQFDNPVQWFYDPMCAPFVIGQLESSAIVYDCMDELSQFKFAPRELTKRERCLLHSADVVFVGGRKLHKSKLCWNANSHFYGCGVDHRHFGKARNGELSVPFDLDFVHRPILGYFGVIDERLDYELIDKVAAANPDWSVVMIGPVAKVDPNSLPARTNLYWLGRRDYTALPSYCKAFSVSLMPFALNEATEYINPTKALEYMAVGRPIVSSAVPDVISNFGDVVKVAHSHDEFIEWTRIAISSPGQFNTEGGLKMAEQNGWGSIVRKLESHIRDVFMEKTPSRDEPFAERK